MFDLDESREALEGDIDVAAYRSTKPGDIVTFGVYPQTAGDEDRSPIKWLVLQNLGDELFLLSESILDCKRYHADWVDITWRHCDLRRWLNEEFYNVAFNDVEKGFIQTTLCVDNGEGKPDTEDKVFLLGVAEVKGLTDIIGKDVLRRALGTEFAKAEKDDGCHLYVYDKSVQDDYLTNNGQKHGYSWWWLRTQIGDSSRATFIGTRASIRSYGRVNLKYYGVRPALRLRLG